MLLTRLKTTVTVLVTTGLLVLAATSLAGRADDEKPVPKPAADAKPAKPKTDRERLTVGAWEMKSLAVGGKEVKTKGKALWYFREEGVYGFEDGRFQGLITYSFDETRKPRTIDIAVKEGSDTVMKGRSGCCSTTFGMPCFLMALTSLPRSPEP